MSDLRADLTTALAAFLPSETSAKAGGSSLLPAAARGLFATLGYQSQRTLRIVSVKQFCEHWDTDGTLTAKERTSLNRLSELHFLFQLTDAELSTQNDLFTDPGMVDGTRIHSYLFLAAELPAGTYSRTDLTAIARALNKPLKMPALVLFKHGLPAEGPAKAGDCLSTAGSTRPPPTAMSSKRPPSSRTSAAPRPTAPTSKSLPTSPSIPSNPRIPSPTSSSSTPHGARPSIFKS